MRFLLRRMKFVFCALLCLPAVTAAQVQLSGNNHLEYSIHKDKDFRFFENWTDVNLRQNNWRLGARYEFHLPPATFSQQPEGQELSQRFLEYRKGGLTLRAGNFYSLLGKGLVLRSFENRTLRWDTNIDGIKFDFRHKLIDLQLLGGKPRDPGGNRLDVTQGGEIRLKPFSQVNFGGTFVLTDVPSRNDPGKEESFNRGSVFGELNFDFGTFYGEYGRLKYPDSYPAAFFPEGKAIYLSGNIFLGALSLLGEYKEYEDFAIEAGFLNNPPTVIREHIFTLMNRQQLIQNANDEQGYQLEASYPVVEDGIALVNYSLTENRAGDRIYEDIYAHFEWYGFLGGEWFWAGGQQKDLVRRYLNFVNSTSYQISDYYALKLIYEHQHARVETTGRQYYDQLLTLGISRAPTWTVSFLGEHSTDQISDKNYWGGIQVDINFLDNFDLSIFGGTRRKGKVCVGGICVVKPELEGVEFTLINRF